MAPLSGEGGAEKTPPTDWAEVFADLVCHTSISKNDIPYMSIPEIQAYRSMLGKNIALKSMGYGDILGTGSVSNSNNNEVKEESTQEDVEAFFGGF